MQSGRTNILRFLGLAAKAGRVTSGFDMGVSAIKKGHARLLILSEDISRNTLNKLLDEVSKANINMPDAYSFGTQFELGNAIGKPDRAIVVVTDDGFAKKLSEMLSQLDEQEDIH